MSKISYLKLATEASNNEKQHNWEKAEELWLLASELTNSGSVNNEWSTLRANFCAAQKRSHNKNWRMYMEQ